MWRSVLSLVTKIHRRTTIGSPGDTRGRVTVDRRGVGLRWVSECGSGGPWGNTSVGFRGEVSDVGDEGLGDDVRGREGCREVKVKAPRDVRGGGFGLYDGR